MARIEHPRLGSAPDRLVDLSDVAPTRGPSVISTTHVGDGGRVARTVPSGDRGSCRVHQDWSSDLVDQFAEFSGGAHVTSAGSTEPSWGVERRLGITGGASTARIPRSARVPV